MNSHARLISALFLAASLVLPAKSATANDLSVDDYVSFHNLELRTRPVGDELSQLIIHPPMPHDVAPMAAIETAARTRECLILLAANLDAFEAKLGEVKSLVGVAAKMDDRGDELKVLDLLNIVASGFVAGVKFERQKVDFVVAKSACSQDGATIAKSQEMLRFYGEAALLVQSIIKRIAAYSQH
jgi:hypothetical protein